MVFHWLRRLQRIYYLRKKRIPIGLWQSSVDRLPVFQRLTNTELNRLRGLSSLFLHEKAINGARGLEVTEEMRIQVAAQASLLILNLDLDYYDGWHEIIIYPDSFVVQHEEVDAAGVVHQRRRVLDGEAWGRGPVIFSWEDARLNSLGPATGSNVIIHELAHKLDMLNGEANGMPPLHRTMNRQQWTDVFTQAFNQLTAQLEVFEDETIDPYAADSPGEFFSVTTEYFFEAPQILFQEYPKVYEELRKFFRQDPLGRSVSVTYN